MVSVKAWEVHLPANTQIDFLSIDVEGSDLAVCRPPKKPSVLVETVSKRYQRHC